MQIKIIAYLLFISTSTFATHLIGGFITLEHQTGYTYKVRFVSYTNVGPQIQADRCIQTILFSDGDSIIAPRVNGPMSSCPFPATMGVVIANGIKYNVYEGIKTFNNPGNYLAWTLNANRNDGIINIPNSVNMPIYVETYISVLDPNLYCPVSTIDFGHLPILTAKTNNIFKSDLPIIKSDGDSVTYQIDTCKFGVNMPIVGYILPQGTSLNTNYGKFKIDAQSTQGQYAFALKANKFRNGVLVSYTIVDFNFLISGTLTNNVQLPLTSNLTINSDSVYVGSFATNDTIRINYNNAAQHQINIFSEINNSLISQNVIGTNTALSIANLGALDRKQSYKITIRAIDNPMTNNAGKDYIFYFTVGNTDSLLCTLPQDLGGKNIVMNEVVLYPNPSQNELFIGNAPLNSNILIYNLQGQMVFYTALQKTSINISELTQGLYFYKINDLHGGLISNGKIIKE